MPMDCTGKIGVRAADVRKSQEAWARHLGRNVEETIEAANGVTMTFVLVPPGKFRMGSPRSEDEREGYTDADETLHEVTLTEPFYLGKYEVTQEQYEALTGKNPSQFRGAERPVEQVNFEEAREYGINLTIRRLDKHVYRLPSESEWEYSCRGGRPSSNPFGIGDGRSLSSRESNFDGNFPYGGADKGENLKETCKVGSYNPNALGLYDMHGNAWEWCMDWYGKYPPKDVANPTGPEEGSNRVIRGGSWGSHAAGCRSAYRSRFSPNGRHSPLGFRVARVPSASK
jgi:formylglycine-generating enzyme required for sulfatase activity